MLQVQEKYNTNYKNNGKYSPNTAKEGKFLTESTDIIIKPVNINKDRLFFIYIDYFMNLSPIVEINSKLVKSNIEYLRNKNPHSKIMFIVKANAYGVGIENIYKVTNNLVDAYGIARIEEYYVLKSLGCTKDIIFLSGIYAECFDFKIPKNVIPILGNELLIKDYIKYEDDKSKQVMLDFDCGMGRFGFYKDDFIKHLYKLKMLDFQI